MATVIVPGTDAASFAPVAKHYGASIAPCPPGGQPQGVGGSRGAFRHGPMVADPGGGLPEAAQVSLDRFWATTGDARLRSPGRIRPLLKASRPRWPTVGELADAEPLLALPAAAFPATVEDTAVVDHQASVAAQGEPLLGAARLSSSGDETVPPAGQRIVGDSQSLGDPAGHPPSGRPRGEADRAHPRPCREALEKVILGQFATPRPGPADRKANRPPGSAAMAERARLLGQAGSEPSVDLEAVAEVVRLAFAGSVDVDGHEGDRMSANSDYQKLRSHLATLRLAAAAEACPAC